LTVDTAGDIFVDTNTRDEKDVLIKFTWAYDASVNPTLGFKVTVGCPALTTPTVNDEYLHDYTLNGATTLATSLIGTAIASTPTSLNAAN